VGSPRASASGAVHLFCDMGGSKWTYQGKLYPEQPTSGDEFGWSVALSGATALIGAPDIHRGKQSGVAYLFQISATGEWQQIAKLAASNAAADDNFGSSVALSGDMAIVGSPGARGDQGESGASYLFKNDGNGNWNEVAKLRPDHAGVQGIFGYAVAVDGQTAVVGTLEDCLVPGSNSSVNVFQRDHLGMWIQVAKLTDDNVTSQPLFGRSLALSGDTLLVGSAGDSSRQHLAGAAYVFHSDGQGSWRQVAKLTTADAEANDQFGWSVALRGNTALVGAVRRHDSAGGVYTFQADSAGNWKQTGTYSAKDARANDWLGSSVALSGDTCLAGAPQQDATAPNSGSAYVFYSGVPAAATIDRSFSRGSPLRRTEVKHPANLHSATAVMLDRNSLTPTTRQ
jgi:hypothetical protein